MIDPMVEIMNLKAEVERLNKVVRDLTAALKVLTEKDERAKSFLSRVEELLD